MKNEKKITTNFLKEYFWILGFLKPYKLAFLCVVACSIFITAVELLMPKVIQVFIDAIVPDKNTELFTVIIGILVVLLFCKIIVGSYKVILERKIQEQASRDLQVELFNQLRRLGFSFFEKTPIGEILSLMNKELNAAQEIYRRYLPGMINGFIFSIISVGIMLYTNVLLSLIIVPSLLVYYIIGPYFEKKAAMYGRKMSENSVNYNQRIYESIASLKEVRAFSQEQWNIKRVLEKLRIHNLSMINTYLYEFVRGSIRRATYYLGAMLLFVVGSYLIRVGDLTIGEFIAFLLYYFTTMHQITSVITVLTEQKVLMHQITRLYEFTNRKPDVFQMNSIVHFKKIKGDIKFDNVYFQYPNSPDILHNFSLDIKRGENIGIVGTSGCGKSTLFKLVARFYDPYKGDILIDGTPIKNLSFEQLRNSVGYVFQETFLFGGSIKENIRFGNPQVSDSEILEAAKLACAHEFIQELPDSYETIVGERGVKLSGGQKQRIAIARMIIKNPQVVLLDEATSALDTITEREVQKNLESFLKEKTTITIAHRISTIKDYDKIIVLENGTIVEAGTYNDLINRQGKLFSLLKGREDSNYLEGETVHA
ncbi:ABC transporter ATP-binding protein [Bacillus pseudomycoides]|uniref:ABC transporter ATP-binding protein n=1 Tax=Bacillus pseudomycoides TaxID=64104 RepID=UPI000BF4E54C|nr:ABC transporter ATP-binding protein [Bacillus pseudomycoides]PGD73693.1 ABC transporter [Bacillus pseudomycoides]